MNCHFYMLWFYHHYIWRFLMFYCILVLHFGTVWKCICNHLKYWVAKLWSKCVINIQYDLLCIGNITLCIIILLYLPKDSWYSTHHLDNYAQVGDLQHFIQQAYAHKYHIDCAWFILLLFLLFFYSLLSFHIAVKGYYTLSCHEDKITVYLKKERK